jgi:ElaB/YqjD/DUF883 family membrane-anchored ribosome-binding protein
MSEPAFCNIPAAETTAATLREKAEATLQAAQRLRSSLQERFQQVSNTVTETAAQLPAFKQELTDDAQRLARRARLYHQARPISALGVVAAAAFALGIVIGLGRH